MLKHPLRRATVVCALLVLVYFLVPVRPTDSNVVARTISTAVLVAVAAWIILREIRKTLNDPLAPLAGLILAIITGLLAFSLVDYIIAVSEPGQFQEIQTRVDGLYFGLATLATIGYGDAHAEGQLARVIVSVQMVFNLVIIGAAVSLLSAQLHARTGRKNER